MSAFGLPADRTEAVFEEPRRLWQPPAEGWSTVLIVSFMLGVVGWAVDDARWAGFAAGGGSQTAFLPYALMIGGLVGLGLAKSRLSPIAAHLVGSAIGAGYLLFVIAGIVSDAAGVVDRLRALNASAAVFYDDLFVQGIRSAETSMFLLTVGGVAWATGLFAAFNVFRRHRPLPAIVVAGVVLLINVSVTVKAQYAFLVLFSLAAMLLLVRLNLMEQREGWLHRRIGDAGYVSGLFMRSGAVFVTVTLVGALVLAATASSAPLARAWRDADDKLIQFGNELNKVVGGVTGAARGPSGLFSSAQTIRGLWESSSEIVFRAATSDGRGYYWRGATYDDFDGTTWQQLDRTGGGRVAAGSAILSGTEDFVVEDDPTRVSVTSTITSVDIGTDVVLSPDAPLALDRDAQVFTHGDGGPFAAIELTDGLKREDSYTVSALVRDEGRPNGGITGNALATAGTDYPDWIDRYLALTSSAAGPIVDEVTNRIVDALPADQQDPYHIAAAIQSYLYSTGGFRYRTDVRNLCGNQRLVDCFLVEKQGYCEYFATAMAVMLRTQGIPSRMVLGYLPGRKLASGEWEVSRDAAHAWVEVYFPGTGWIRFDPTPGNQENGQRATVIPAGPPIATPSPDPDATNRPRATRDLRNETDESADPGAGAIPPRTDGSSGTGGTDPALIAAALVGAVFGLIVLLAVIARRRMRLTTAPEHAYRSVTRIASRFGYAPLPTQTAYEYAGVLAEVVPRVAPELQVVARAKVEATYAARSPEAEGLLALRAAYRRLRIGLLRLVLKRRRSSPRRGLRRPSRQ